MKRWMVVLPILAGVACDQKAQQSPREQQTMTRRDIDSVLNAYAPKIMEVTGVVGVYRGESEKGEPCIRIMLEKKTPDLERSLPRLLEGYPVELEETGKIRPLN